MRLLVQPPASCVETDTFMQYIILWLYVSLLVRYVRSMSLIKIIGSSCLQRRKDLAGIHDPLDVNSLLDGPHGVDADVTNLCL